MTDQETLEVGAIVAYSTITNSLNHLAAPEIAFPSVRTGARDWQHASSADSRPTV